ncbi:MAG: DUF2284 domain-containing protein [Thermovirgaceae bacterium]|nr:DUF2284 domain-containing protein [Thermovirgaceae bacterium]
MTQSAFPLVDTILDAAGFVDHIWVAPSTMTVSQWVRMKCMFGCPDYGRNASCPPNVPSVSECRELLLEYSHAVLIHLVCDVLIEARKEWSRTKQKVLMEAEKQIFLSGNERAFLLSFENCNLCDECVSSPRDCRLPYIRRPTMEAFAIDVYSSVRQHGYSISVKKDLTETADRFALLLIA